MQSLDHKRVFFIVSITGVCKDILTKAGPQIQAQLTGGKKNKLQPLL